MDPNNGNESWWNRWRRYYKATCKWQFGRDPNYGPPNIDGTTGLYTPASGTGPGTLTSINSYVGTLNFLQNGTNLIVGGSYGSEGDDYYEATLSTMPYFYFNFLGSEGGSQGVTVKQGSTFLNIGLLASHDASGANWHFYSVHGWNCGWSRRKCNYLSRWIFL